MEGLFEAIGGVQRAGRLSGSFPGQRMAPLGCGCNDGEALSLLEGHTERVSGMANIKRWQGSNTGPWDGTL